MVNTAAGFMLLAFPLSIFRSGNLEHAVSLPCSPKRTHVVIRNIGSSLVYVSPRRAFDGNSGIIIAPDAMFDIKINNNMTLWAITDAGQIGIIKMIETIKGSDNPVLHTINI